MVANKREKSEREREERESVAKYGKRRPGGSSGLHEAAT